MAVLGTALHSRPKFTRRTRAAGNLRRSIEQGSAYPASDLYSLGVTCFHLLSGIHPQLLWTRQGDSWVNDWRDRLQQPICEELEKILDRLLQVEYQQRYPSAVAVLEQLNALPRSMVVSARGDGNYRTLTEAMQPATPGAHPRPA